jgi:hypothetical protein
MGKPQVAGNPVNDFPLLHLHADEILQFLYSVAYTRAVLEDMAIVTDDNVFGMPGPILNTMRVDSASPGDPQAVLRLALGHFGTLVDGWHARQDQGPEKLKRYFDSLVMRKDQLRAQIKHVHENVNKWNKTTLEFFTTAAQIANVTRALGTVVLAGGAAIAAVGGSGGAALVFTGYKVVSGAAGALIDQQDAWENARGIMVGSYDDGALTFGELTQPMVDHAGRRLVTAYRDEMARQIRSQRGVLDRLNKSLAASTKRVIELADAKSFKPGNKILQGQHYRTVVRNRAAIAAEKQAMQHASAKGIAAGVVRKGVPIVFLALDLMNAWNEYQQTERRIMDR